MELGYALFLGCIIPAREPSYELSVRKVFKAFGVDLVDLKGSTCCAPILIESIDFKTSLATGAHNIYLAEELGLDLMTICNGCFQSLSRVNALLRGRTGLKAEVNEILSKLGEEFKGAISVKDYLQVLYSDLGLERVKKNVFKPLKGLRVAVFYGCHVLKPSSTLRFDDPENPRILDELVEATGAESVPYMYKLKCCGGLLRGVSEEVARRLARDKLFNISQAKVDCIVTVCPFCFIQLDVGQLEVARIFNEQYNIPVLHYSELLGLSMGMGLRELGLHTHRVLTESLLGKIG